jgi:hypothetical protein
VALLAPPAPRGPRSRRVVVSLPSSRGDLSRRSDDLRLTSQLGWLERRAWACEDPPAWSPPLPDFPWCTLQDCRLQLPPGVGPVPAPILPYQRWPSGRGKTPLAPPPCPHSAPRGDPWSTARAFAFAPALRVARLLGCSARATAQPASGFYVRAASPHVTLRTAGYHDGATWGIAPTGLAPASTTVRLAALPPVGRLGLTSPPSPLLGAATTAT